MATLAQIHKAIADRLRTIDGLRVFEYPPQGTTPPVAFVNLTSWAPETMSRGGVRTHSFDVYVLTAQSVDPQYGYQALMEYADVSGTKSIHLAIWDGNTTSTSFGGLDGVNAYVSQFEVLGTRQVDALEMYGGVFTVEVRNRGAA